MAQNTDNIGIMFLFRCIHHMLTNLNDDGFPTRVRHNKCKWVHFHQRLLIDFIPDIVQTVNLCVHIESTVSHIPWICIFYEEVHIELHDLRIVFVPSVWYILERAAIYKIQIEETALFLLHSIWSDIHLTDRLWFYCFSGHAVIVYLQIAQAHIFETADNVTPC